MAKGSFDIQKLINQVVLLKRKAPNDETLIEQYDQLVELQENVQEKEWDDNFQQYLDAKKMLEAAKAEADKKLKDLEKIATTVDKVTTVTDKLAKFIAAIVKLV
jgi:hypothetical protein